MRNIIPGVVSILLFIGTVVADVPTVMNYQGWLTDSGGDPVADGSYSVTFTIYDASSGGSSKWSETQSVNTSNGLFSVLLGSSNAIEDTVFNMPDRYLGIQVAGDPELSPRTRLASVPYAMHSSTTASSAGNGWFVGGTLEDLYNGGGELTLYPHLDYMYGIRRIDNMIQESVCTKWNAGMRFYNLHPFFVDSDDPSGGMRYGGNMFYIDTNDPADDAATPALWRHAYWSIDYTISGKAVTLFGSNGFQTTNVYVKKR